MHVRSKEVAGGFVLMHSEHKDGQGRPGPAPPARSAFSPAMCSIIYIQG